MESLSIQLDYLDSLLKIVDLLELSDNSVERQRSLYYLRQLSTIKISAGDSGDGPTSLFCQVKLTEKQEDLFHRLSNLGTESLLTSKERW